MKPCLKVKSNKCFGQIQTSDEVKLAKMCQLFMKVSLDLELGPRLENAALRFNHIQRRLSKNNSPKAAAGRFDHVSKTATDRLDTFRKSDSIKFSKPRRLSKKENIHEPSKLQQEDNGARPVEKPMSFTEPVQNRTGWNTGAIFSEEPLAVQSLNQDKLDWEVASLNEPALPFLGAWEQIYQESTCWDWQAPYIEPFMDGFQQNCQDPFQDMMNLLSNTPTFQPELVPQEAFFSLNEHIASQHPALEMQDSTDISAELHSQPSTSLKEKLTEDEPECHNCGVTSTPLWRFPSGRGRLCNACGLYYKMHKRQRPIELKKHSDAKKPPYRPRSLECMDCNSHSTSLWRRDSKTGRPLCNSCGLYRRIKHQKRPEHLYNSKIKRRHRNTNSSPDFSSVCNTPFNQEFKDLCPVEYFGSEQN